MSYDRQNPFYATLKERYCLNRPGSSRETLHLVLDLKGSGLIYRPGDSFGILPKNDPALVEKTLAALLQGSQTVIDKKSGVTLPLSDYLAKGANLMRVSKPLTILAYEKQADGAKKKELESVLKSTESWNAYASAFEVWDFLEEHAAAKITSDELIPLLQPLLPRFYSVASSQAVVGDEVHLTLSVVEYVTRGVSRIGVASQFLGRQVPLNEPVVPLYLQPAHSFSLPEDHEAHIIMVGPGTGIAPFRAFMQERMAKGASGKNWLFFGERQKAYDFLYEEYWSDLQQRGLLDVETAFSRDQSDKIYVQHRLIDRGKALWQWLNEGAYFYVCGDAHTMAKDVDAALHLIVAEHGRLSESESRAFIKALKTEKRYLRDVY